METDFTMKRIMRKYNTVINFTIKDFVVVDSDKFIYLSNGGDLYYEIDGGITKMTNNCNYYKIIIVEKTRVMLEEERDDDDSEDDVKYKRIKSYFVALSAINLFVLNVEDKNIKPKVITHIGEIFDIFEYKRDKYYKKFKPEFFAVKPDGILLDVLCNDSSLVFEHLNINNENVNINMNDIFKDYKKYNLYTDDKGSLYFDGSTNRFHSISGKHIFRKSDLNLDYINQIVNFNNDVQFLMKNIISITYSFYKHHKENANIIYLKEYCSEKKRIFQLKNNILGKFGYIYEFLM